MATERIFSFEAWQAVWQAVWQEFLKDIKTLHQRGIILNPPLFKVAGAYAAQAMIPTFRFTSDIDVIVSDAREIENLLAQYYPAKYCIDDGQTERNLYRKPGTPGSERSSWFPIDLITISSMPQEHPVISNMFSVYQISNRQHAFATLLDLIVLKLGAIFSTTRNRDKIPQDKLDLKTLVNYQNDVMRQVRRPKLDATECSGEDLHARYLYCYYDGPEVVRHVGSILCSWLYLSPGPRPNLLNARGRTVLRDYERGNERQRWESEHGDVSLSDDEGDISDDESDEDL
ncbi:uncharacterized protein EV420DRAFT_1707897 [Desarmillaria tabescens]|uniref:Uncharacterized protein n=1 Tax=Armillaria tabescens TaxID=1929756 RepID=A0AA39MWY1_ARMTA|nr:uncharacterized protein EV420DRAFT_1707897 [Desarmillaria tabescens]KAK0449672.1 hypothetical protein EV420DRAFT_1707897 [Desarmillaria tabescens]